MNWAVPVALRIFTAYVVCHPLTKLITGKHSRSYRLFVMYLFCALLAGIWFLANGSELSNAVLIPVIMGLFGGFAAYCQWRAIDISLSKNSIFTVFDDIIAMGLSFFILQESKIVNGGIALGIALCLLSFFLFSRRSYLRRAISDAGQTPLSFFVFVGAYSSIFGVCYFLKRYFAVEGIPAATVILGWYLGTLLSSIGIIVLKIDKTAPVQTASGAALPRFLARDYTLLFVLAASVVASQLLLYWSLSLAPQNIVQPYYLLGEMIIPALFGLYIFGERRSFDKIEMLYFAMGIIGGLLIACNYSGLKILEKGGAR